jgi:hypothetical protein
MLIQPQKSGTISDLFAVLVYPLFQERALLFVKMGQVEEIPGKGYCITTKGMQFRNLINKLQKLMGIEHKSGLYSIAKFPKGKISS